MNNESPIYHQEGPDKGRVVDPDVARVIADAENKVKDAQDFLDKTTDTLEKQGGIPLTEQQRLNLEFINKVKDRFPDALIKLDVVGGDDLYLVQPKEKGTQGSSFVDLLTKDGPVNVYLSQITPAKDYGKIRWGDLMEIAREKRDKSAWVTEHAVSYDRVMNPEDTKNFDTRYPIKVEFRDPKMMDEADFKRLKEEIEMADSRGKIRKEDSEKSSAPVDLAARLFD